APSTTTWTRPAARSAPSPRRSPGRWACGREGADRADRGRPAAADGAAGDAREGAGEGTRRHPPGRRPAAVPGEAGGPARAGRRTPRGRGREDRPGEGAAEDRRWGSGRRDPRAID